MESLGSTQLNLLLNVLFNKEGGNLAQLIDRADEMSPGELNEMSLRAKYRIKEAYSWKFIADEFEKIFLHNSDATKK